jgi:hypothetical protein
MNRTAKSAVLLDSEWAHKVLSSSLKQFTTLVQIGQSSGLVSHASRKSPAEKQEAATAIYTGSPQAARATCCSKRSLETNPKYYELVIQAAVDSTFTVVQSMHKPNSVAKYACQQMG